MKSPPKENRSHPEEHPKDTSKTVENSRQDTQETNPKQKRVELPFAQEGPELDVDGTLKKTLRKMRKISAKYSKTPRALKILKPAKGWTSWNPSGKKKRRNRKVF